MLVLDNISCLVTVCPDADVRFGGGSSEVNITTGGLLGRAMSHIGVLRDACVCVDGEAIVWVGPSSYRTLQSDDVVDCKGKTVMPGFVDSHTHMAFVGSRSDEFARRLQGATYQQIADDGGGIMSSVRSVRGATVQQIVTTAQGLVRSAVNHGTTTIEVKTGYGLSTRDELKLIDAIAILQRDEFANIVGTFLGAHDVPIEFRDDRESYITEVIDVMMPAVAAMGVVEFCDVFFDTGYYTRDESARILRAGMQNGLRAKVHADELSYCGGGELAAELGAISADHLLKISDEGIAAMTSANVVATLLPGTAFFLGLPYAPARKMIEQGMCVAIASDCNPGSNMSENMQMVLALACMQMHMSIEEAIAASTINGAAALGRTSTIGSIEPGKHADIIVCDVPDYRDIVYHYGVNHVIDVFVRGRRR